MKKYTQGFIVSNFLLAQTVVKLRNSQITKIVNFDTA